MNQPHVFSYSIVYFTDYELNNKPLYKHESGFGLAESFTEACRILEHYYGKDDLISIKNLKLYDEQSLIAVSKDIIKAYENCEIVSNYPCDEEGNPVAESL